MYVDVWKINFFVPLLKEEFVILVLNYNIEEEEGSIWGILVLIDKK